jgi:hypothetical protein
MENPSALPLKKVRTAACTVRAPRLDFIKRRRAIKYNQGFVLKLASRG